MSKKDLIVQELGRYFSFPPGRPTKADVDAIAAAVNRLASPTQADVERAVTTQIPQTRVHRFDGLTFQDISALLALIRAQAQVQAKK